MKAWVLTRVGFQGLALVLAVGFTTLILVAAGAPPLEAYRNLVTGSFGSFKKFTDGLVSWVPLLLVTSGLLATFAAGLWNIGVEGQITLGAIATTWALRELDGRGLPAPLTIMLSIIAGAVG